MIDPFPPTLTADLPGTGGTVRAEPGDFVVEEVPLYLPAGAGDHAYLWIEKVGIPTREAVRRLARALDAPERAFGWAGLKDARAIARQWVSVEHVPPARAEGLSLPGVRVLAAKAHRNKLRVGHLAGNRFEVRVRGVAPGAAAAAERVLEVLRRRGMPNGYGPQRFGARGHSAAVGRALVRRDADGALAALLGGGAGSGAEADERIREARRRFDAGDPAGAAAILPPAYGAERRVLERLVAGATPARALGALPPPARRFLVNAYQAALFNRVLARRMPDLDRLRAGDLAFLHGRGAVFSVEDPAAEQPRADAFEISPSGPLFGTRVPLATGEPGAGERAVLAEEGLEAASFAVDGTGRFEGERRPLRVPVAEAAAREEGGDLLLSFRLPRGAYATVLLREVTKGDPGEEPEA